MTRRVVLAPDSFKGTASAADAAAALARGWRSVAPDDDLVEKPMADGGEGTLDAFAASMPGAERVPVTVQGPDDAPVDAAWLRLPDGTAVVELAMTSGITLLDPLRPLDAHTVGFGQAIAAALDDGATRLMLAIGGSSSTDGGVGALTALGAAFLDAQGRPIARGNRGIAELASVDLSGLRPLPPEGALILSDVTNPLLGPFGAAAIFGPQKGATPELIEAMDQHLAKLPPRVHRPHEGRALHLGGRAHADAVLRIRHHMVGPQLAQRLVERGVAAGVEAVGDGAVVDRVPGELPVHVVRQPLAVVAAQRVAVGRHR